MYIYQSIKHFTAAFLFATGGYAAQAQTTDAGIMPFLGLETNARTAGMAGAATAVADNPLAVYIWAGGISTSQRILWSKPR